MGVGLFTEEVSSTTEVLVDESIQNEILKKH